MVHSSAELFALSSAFRCATGPAGIKVCVCVCVCARVCVCAQLCVCMHTAIHASLCH